MSRFVVTAVLSAVLLTGCGALVTADASPLPTPVVIRQVVTSVVIQTVVVTATPLAATATPRATATPKVKPTAVPQPTATPKATGNWKVDTSKSSMDDSMTVALSLDAEETIQGPYGDPVTPTLIARCQEHEREVYVWTGMRPDVESDNLDHATVRVRYDSDPAQTLNTGQSTNGMSLFFPDGPGSIDALLKHREWYLSSHRSTAHRSR